MDLTTRLDRRLARPGDRSDRYLQLTIAVPGESAGPQRRLPINLALVLDRSGSMTGEKLARARDAAAFVVRHLTSADRVAIVAYDDEVEVVHRSVALTPQAKAELLRAIGRIKTDGSTNLSGGWFAGCEEVARHQLPEGIGGQIDRVLLLTDGLANVGIIDPGELCHHAAELRRRGITTSTMGIGRDFNEELLEAMARQGGGRFQYVETARHIPDCVQGELGEILSVAARRVEVEVALPSGVVVADLLNELPIERGDRSVRIRLDDLLAGDVKRLSLRLTVDGAGRRVGDELTIDAAVTWHDVVAGAGRRDIFPAATLHFADPAACDAEAADPEVMAEVAILLAAREREQAVRLARAGQEAAARQALHDAWAALSPALPFSAHARALADDLGRKASPTASLDEATLKELHYQTYLDRQGRRRYDRGQGKGKDTDTV